MKHAIRTAAAFALASLLCSGASAEIVTFEIPAFGIEPASINNKGELTGYYLDEYGEHGFLWQPDGTLTSFDVTDAERTDPAGISPEGVITGQYYTPNSTGGFVRAVDGSITTFNVRHVNVTEVNGVNAKGWSVGEYLHRPHGPPGPFLRSPFGATTKFTVPGATGGAIAVAVNRSRMIAGEALIHHKYENRGFIRTPDGTATLFGDPAFFTSVRAMNDTGTVTGWMNQQQFYEGFVRTVDGTMTTFVGPNGAMATLALAINKSGTVAGGYADSHEGTYHGFLRTADGTFTPFNVAGSYSTTITAINDKGAIAGIYQETDGFSRYRVFVGKP